MRKKTIGLVFLIILLLAISTGIGLYLGMREDQQEEKKVMIYPGHIRLLQYNVVHGLTVQNNLNLDDITELIIQQKPDIVCLNNIDKGTKTTGYINQPRKLNESLDMEYSFGAASKVNEGWTGNAVYTRFPIKFSQNILFREKNDNENAFLYVIMEYEDLELYVLTTSLKKKNFKLRVRELMEFISERELSNKHLIIAGTFPSKEQNLDFKEFASKYKSLYDFTDLSFNFPASKLEYKYDFIFFNKNLKILDGKILDSELTRQASEHLPLSANIDIQPKE